jgi:hypothetical protein
MRDQIRTLNGDGPPLSRVLSHEVIPASILDGK